MVDKFGRSNELLRLMKKRNEIAGNITENKRGDNDDEIHKELVKELRKTGKKIRELE